MVGVLEAVDGVLEAVYGIHEAVYDVLEAVDGVHEAVDDVLEVVDGVFEAVDGVFEAVTIVHEAVDGVFEVVVSDTRNVLVNVLVGVSEELVDVFKPLTSVIVGNVSQTTASVLYGETWIFKAGVGAFIAGASEFKMQAVAGMVNGLLFLVVCDTLVDI